MSPAPSTQTSAQISSEGIPSASSSQICLTIAWHMSHCIDGSFAENVLLDISIVVSIEVFYFLPHSVNFMHNFLITAEDQPIFDCLIH